MILYKVLYGEALPQDLTAYPFVYHFKRTGTPFVFSFTYLATVHPLLNYEPWNQGNEQYSYELGHFHVVLNKVNDTAIRWVCSDRRLISLTLHIPQLVKSLPSYTFYGLVGAASPYRALKWLPPGRDRGGKRRTEPFQPPWHVPTTDLSFSTH